MNPKNDTGPHLLNISEWISCSPFEQLLGMEISSAEAGVAIVRMPFVRALAQGVGLMHGGALVSLADTALVMAIKSIAAPGTHFVTNALESRFLRPVKKGVVTARASVQANGGNTLIGECDILDERDRLVMTTASVFKITKVASKKYPT